MKGTRRSGIQGCLSVPHDGSNESVLYVMNALPCKFTMNVLHPSVTGAGLSKSSVTRIYEEIAQGRTQCRKRKKEIGDAERIR